MIERYKILIISAVENDINQLSESLRDEYELKVIRKWGNVYKNVREFIPNIILLDVSLEDIEGYTACKILKTDPITSEIPVILITSINENWEELKGFNAGAADYLIKPLNTNIVKVRVSLHLALSYQKQEIENNIYKRTRELDLSNHEIIRILGRATEYKLNEKGNHAIRVSEYCYLISTNIGLDDSKAKLIKEAALLHDIGMIGIADKILRKEDSLDLDEFEIVQMHTIIGAEILANQKSEVLQMANIIALEHHERVNGRGYPNKLKSDDISLPSKIVGLADVFDALTNERLYREAWTFDNAVNYILDKSGIDFDPVVVDGFKKSLETIQTVYDYYQD